MSPSTTTPFISHNIIFSTPAEIKSLAVAITEAPAPFMTTFILAISLSTIFKALYNPAKTAIAVQFVITAIVLPFIVYSYAFSLSLAISRHGPYIPSV